MKRPLLLYVGVGLAYAAGSQLAFTWFGADGTGASFFPSAGVTLAALVLTRRRQWPIVLAAAGTAEFVLDQLHGIELVPTLGYVAANLTEPLVGALLLTALVKARVDLSRTRDLSLFVVCAVIAGPAAGAVLGATTKVVLSDGEGWLPFAGQWLVGDGLGVLVVAGSVLALRTDPPQAFGPLRVAEGLFHAGLALAATVVVFWLDWLPLVYVPIALLVVIAFRVGTAGVALTGAGVAFLAAEATSEGHTFWDTLEITPATGVVYLQLALLVLVASSLTLAAEIAQRERAAAAWASADAARKESFTMAVHAERLRSLAEAVGHATTTKEVAAVLEEYGFGGVVGLPPLDSYGEGTERYLRESAGRIARDAYARVQLLETERAARTRAELLERHAKRLAAATTVGEVAVATVSLVEQAGIEIAGVERRHGDVVEVLAVTGVSQAAIDRYSDYPLAADTPGAAAIRAGAVVEVGSAEEFDRCFPASADLRAQHGVQAIIAIPLRDGAGKVTGALSAALADPALLDDELRLLLGGIAEQTGLALERAASFVAEQAAREHAEELERRASLLQQVTAALAAARTTEELGTAVVTQLIPAVGGMGGSIFVLAEDGALHLVAADSCSSDVLDRFTVMQLDHVVPATDAVRSGEPLLYGVRDDMIAAYPDLGEEVPLGDPAYGAAWAHVPLVAGAKRVGLLIVAYSEPRSFDGRETAYLLSAAEAAGQALARVLLDEAERDARWRAETLERHAKELAASASVRQVVDATVGVLSEIETTTLWLVEGAEMVIAGSSGLPEETREAFARVPTTIDSLVGEVIRTGAPVEVRTAAEYDERFPGGAKARRLIGSESVRSVPLVAADGRVQGALTVSSRAPRWLTASLRQLLDGMAEQTSLALERARLHEQAERTAAEAAFLVRLGDVLERAPSADVRARRLVELLEEDLGIRCCVRILDEEDAGWRLVAESDAWNAAEVGTWEAIPLRARGRTLGALELRNAGDAVRGSLGREIAARAAISLDNALLYDRERKVSHTLQLGLLGGALAEAEGLELAAAYRAGTAALDVGGDWYDAFRLPDGSLVLVVGDVVGHGLDAAIVMGQLRGAVRALAPGCEPARLLEQLDLFVETLPDAGMATIAYVVLDPASGAFRYACAGHPPPLLVSASGESRFLWDGRSAAIGSMLGLERADAADALEPDETLVLYTDGVVERRSESLDVGLERLALAATAQLRPERLVEHVPDVLLEGQTQDDDVCLLAVRRVGAGVELAHTFPASPAELAPLRARLREWLEAAGVEPDVVEGALLGISEAAANSIEHGLRFDESGTVTVEARITDEGRLLVTVRDDGRWRESSGDPDRGRGLQIISAVMDGFAVDRHETGTVVRMERTVKRVSAV